MFSAVVSTQAATGSVKPMTRLRSAMIQTAYSTNPPARGQLCPTQETNTLASPIVCSVPIPDILPLELGATAEGDRPLSPPWRAGH
jgi:hypothetical protein